MTAIISMTTIPSRIEHIEPCVDSLLAQGLPVYLWVTKKIKRSKAVLAGIPEFLKHKPGLTVTMVEERGPITKLLPTLEAGHEIVITADDDHTYGPRWAAGLLKQAKSRPDVAVCYRGRIFGKSKRYKQSKVIRGELRFVDFIAGSLGALYRRSFFGDSIFEEWKQWPINDDIVISAHLKRRGVPMLVIPLPKGCCIGTLACKHIDPLYQANVKRGMNDKGLEKVFW